MRTREQFLNYRVGLGLDFVFVFLFRFTIYMVLVYSFVLLLAFIVLGLVSSVPSQEIGSVERRNDIFCVEWDGKP